MKKQAEEKVAVKREVVSANLEVVSEEKFARRLEGMNSCINCQRERTKSHHSQQHHGHQQQHQHHHHHHQHQHQQQSLQQTQGQQQQYHHHHQQQQQQQQHPHQQQQQQHHHHHQNPRKHYRGKGKRKPQVKANTPIVIHLKDTLRAVLQQRQRSLDSDAEAPSSPSPSSPHTPPAAESMHVSDIAMGDYRKAFQGPQDYVPTSGPLAGHFSECPRQHPHHSASARVKKKDTKNLHALISVIQKAHHKDSKNLECNLARDCDSKLSDLLNNATSRAALEHSAKQRRSIVECDNVQLICNDLHNNGSDRSCYEDSESDKCSVTSGSENSSDFDATPHSDDTNFEFSSEELEKLAAYTTGCPLYRYDCPPAECHECLSAWYYYQQYCQYQACSSYPSSSSSSSSSSASSPGVATHRSTADSSAESEEETETDQGSVHSGEGAIATATATAPTTTTRSPTVSISSDCTAVDQEEEEEEEEEIEITAEGATATASASASSSSSSSASASAASSPTVKTHRQLWDIGVSQRSKTGQTGYGSFPDSVYIDLTGTDVSVTVYYYHGSDDFASSHSSLPPWHPQPSPFYYWPAYYMPHYYGLASPLGFLNEASLPRTAMVPPHELKKFNSTAPPARNWLNLQPPTTGNHVVAPNFTVMCYNVLCDKYCTKQMYGYCPSWALNWEFRKKGIMEEIRGCGADIISLQEVETDQYYNYFLVELRRMGYDGIFSPKSRARTMTEGDRKHVDGCAIFFRSNKFQLLQEHLIEFNQLAMANAQGSDEMLNRVMTKDNIGLAAVLQTKDGFFEHGSGNHMPDSAKKQVLLVATAHIHWDPEYSDVKLIQTMMLMAELKRIVEETATQHNMKSSDPNAIPLILCGDLNSLPNSGVIEFLVKGKVPPNHEDFRMLGYETCLQKLNPSNDKMLSHGFRIKRSYTDDIMPHTNYTFDFKGIIDYIFFSQDHLNLLGVLGSIEDSWFVESKVLGCPHPHVPSDHFPLLVQLELPIRRSSR